MDVWMQALRYCPGGFMEPHRDLQGTVMFPFQVMCPLSDPGRSCSRQLWPVTVQSSEGEDYEGGRFFVQPGKRNVDRRHCQALPWVLAGLLSPSQPLQELFKGDVVVFRSGLYHGLEELTSGTRYATPGSMHDWPAIAQQLLVCSSVVSLAWEDCHAICALSFDRESVEAQTDTRHSGQA